MGCNCKKNSSVSKVRSVVKPSKVSANGVRKIVTSSKRIIKRIR